MIKQFETQWGGKTLSIEVGRFAGQANGSCTVRYGDTVILATATMSELKREGIDFFPLMVDLEERYGAAGKIKGSRFIKREGRPSDDAVTTARMIDRSLRPLFDSRLRNDVQVIATALSVDLENSADIPALIASSCALAISDIPWEGPIGGIRIGRIPSEDNPEKSEWVINPSLAAQQKSALDLIVAGGKDRVIMIEAGAREIPEDIIEEAFAFALKHLAEPLKLIEQVVEAAGQPKRPMLLPGTDEEAQAESEKRALLEEARAFLLPKIRVTLFENPKATKEERRTAKQDLVKELDAHLIEKQIGKEKRLVALAAVGEFIEEEVSRAILEEERRVDGRKLDEIRPLQIEVSVLPRTHGSAHFSRGETQVLSTLALGAPSMEQILDTMERDEKRHYMHHYYFPPYSVGEVKPLRGAGRREIGHGALAERALLPVLPGREQFPYTIRVVSEVLSSNGSSSMASACGSTMALMDAGVPIKAAVAGLAMGLASDPQTNKYKVFTDLQDLEDGKGGMDFKVCGTRAGITAIQMDTKTKGLTMEMVRETFAKAHASRLQLLEEMARVLSAPRPELSPYAPRIYTLQINPERIRDVIGPGGKIINEIIDKTGVEIDIEQSGLVFITSTSASAAERALEWVKNLTREVKVGEDFQGKVTRIMDFGAFVEILPNQEGLVHISRLAPFHVRQVTDVVKVGDIIPVKVIEIDDMGRINLSLKDAPGYSVAEYGGRAQEYANEPPPRRNGFGGAGRPGRPDRRPGGQRGQRRTPRY